MKGKIFFIVLGQMVVIVLLSYTIHQKITRLNLILSPINRESVTFSQSNNYRFFYEPRPNTTESIKRDWLSYSPTYHINSDSLNERYEYKEKKEEKVFRIITLGDSFTFGAYVDTKSNWTELLEDSLNKNNLCSQVKKYEVINLGVDGYDITYEVERYLRRGKKYQPDLIIMLTTDYGRVTEHRMWKNRIMPTLSPKQKEEYRKMGNYYPEANIYDSELSHDYRVLHQVKSIEKLMAEYRFPLLLINFNFDRSYDKDMLQLPKRFKQIILEKMNTKRDDERYLLPDWHPNNDGHKIIMTEIHGFLKKHTLLPCTQ